MSSPQNVSTDLPVAPNPCANTQVGIRTLVLILRNSALVAAGLAVTALLVGSLIRPALQAANVNEEFTALLARILVAAIPFALYLTIGITARRLPTRLPAVALTIAVVTAAYGVVLLVQSLSGQTAQAQMSLDMQLSQVNNGILVENVRPGGAAELAGILSGDIITAIRREAVDLSELEKRVQESSLDTPFRLRILRDGDEIQITVNTVLSTSGAQANGFGLLVSGWFSAALVGLIGLLIPLSWTPYLLLAVSLVPLLLGYTWLIVATFSQQTRGLLPVDANGDLGGLTLSNWSFLSTTGAAGSIWTYTLNSFAIAVSMTAILLVLCSMSAYALSRMEFAGRRFFLSLTLILHGFPAVTLLIPIYLVLINLGVLPFIGQFIGFNTLGGIALVEVAFGLPFGVWLMKGFFDNISWDIERSALIDGATRWRTFWEIILPQIRPGLMALGIFTFVGGWNTYLIPATFSVGTRAANLPVYIQQLTGETNPVNWNQIAAIGLFQMIPILILFVFAQEYLLNIYSGGTKGSS
jgi:inositol-phosphate transport system permease protein